MSTDPVSFAVTDDATPITTGTKFTWRWQVAATPPYVGASLTVPQSSGPKLTFDVKRKGVSIFSTLPSFDNGKKTLSNASVSQVVIPTAFAYDDEFTVDVTQIGDGTAKGLKLAIWDDLTGRIIPPPDTLPTGEVLIDPALGTPFGDLTVFGLSKAFDGVTNATGSQCAAKSGGGGYIGKAFPVAKIFSRAVIYGRNDGGFVDSYNPSVTIPIYGKVGAPSTPTDGTLIGNISFTDTADESAGRIIVSTNKTSAFDHIWANIVHGTGYSTYCAELTLYEWVP